MAPIASGNRLMDEAELTELWESVHAQLVSLAPQGRLPGIAEVCAIARHAGLISDGLSFVDILEIVEQEKAATGGGSAVTSGDNSSIGGGTRIDGLDVAEFRRALTRAAALKWGVGGVPVEPRLHALLFRSGCCGDRPVRTAAAHSCAPVAVLGPGLTAMLRPLDDAGNAGGMFRWGAIELLSVHERTLRHIFSRFTPGAAAAVTGSDTSLRRVLFEGNSASQTPIGAQHGRTLGEGAWMEVISSVAASRCVPLMLN